MRRDLEADRDRRSREVVQVHVGQIARLRPVAQVLEQLDDAHLEDSAVGHQGDRAGVAAEHLEELRLLDGPLEVGAVRVGHPGLHRDPGLAALGADEGPRALRHLLQDGAEGVLLVAEVVVERPAREVGLPDDVARRRLPEAFLREHLARGLQQLLPVLRLALLPAARPAYPSLWRRYAHAPPSTPKLVKGSRRWRVYARPSADALGELDHDLAQLATAREALVRLRDLVERVGRGNGDANGAIVHERQDVSLHEPLRD